MTTFDSETDEERQYEPILAVEEPARIEIAPASTLPPPAAAGLEENEFTRAKFLEQHPEVAGKTPAGTTHVLLIDPIRLHRSEETKSRVDGWISGSGLPADAIRVAELRDIKPGAVVILSSVAERPANLPTTEIALIDLNITPIDSFTQLIQEVLRQWAGDQPVDQVLGVIRLEDGRLAIFL